METLIKNLKDVYWRTRAKAAKELGEVGDAAAVFPLIDALLDEERVVKNNAVEALGKMGQSAVLPLINVLSNQDNYPISDEVSKALVKIGTQTVKPLVRLLETCLEDGNDIIFTRVANTLGEIGDPEAVLPLINSLNEGNTAIRLDAIRALGKIGDKRAVKPILNDVKKHGSSLEAIIALGELGDSTALPTLLNMLRGKERWAAAKSLGMMGEVAVEPLAALLNDKSMNEQGFVAMALGSTGSAKAVKPLLCALMDPDRIVSWRAAMALVEIGELAVEPLIKMLKEENNYVRMLIVDTFGRIGDKRALNYLEKLKEDEHSEDIRQILNEALLRFRPKAACTFKNPNINLEKDIFVLQVGIRARAFKATLAEDILYLSCKDKINLLRGDLKPPPPVPYRYIGGKTVPDDFIWTSDGFLVSDRIVELFTINKFTGWKTYAINLSDKSGHLIKGYHGFAVTSKVRSIDYSRSKIVAKPNSLFAKPDIVKKGIFFNENNWDGSDIFFAGYILVTSRVVAALGTARPKVNNWEAIRASEYERSIILDTVEPGFLTEEDREEINKLRRAFMKEQSQNLRRSLELKGQVKITNDPGLLHLVKATVRNQCMFKTVSNHDICQEFLKCLAENGEKVIRQIGDALKSEDCEIRLGATWVLGELKVKDGLAPLLEAIKDKDDRVRREVVIALGKIKVPGTAMQLIELLNKEDNTTVRCGIVEALGKIGDPIAIQPLISLLNKEEDVLVMCDIASALGNIGNHCATLPLIELFKYEDSNLAERVKIALINIGKATVIPLIRSLAHAQPLVRGRVASTLGQMCEKKAVLPMIDRLASEKDPEVLAFVVEALGQLGDKRAVESILNLYNSTEIEYLQKISQIAIQNILKNNLRGSFCQSQKGR
ncbi:HEAT repeat domain-containing protein [Desulfotomaculum sp. 1211_IL3151]|uniref:HEAT repeat domain-containing protein n=1 Tax=Desulfotomaculum sp. 1211_IL3151 TaxID=3084055 RepID=UPI002FD9785E